MVASIVAVAVGACALDGDGDGAVLVRVSGEGAATQGYPFEKNGARIAFVDGWSLRFSKVLVSVGAIRLSSADDAVAFDDPSFFVMDLQKGDAPLFTVEAIPARRWDRFSFRVMSPPSGARPIGAVASADIEQMRTSGWNTWLEGVAEKGGLAYSFAWGLANPVRATNCSNGVDGTDGIVVKRGSTSIAEITMHLDHIFWDTLGTELSKLRFDAIAGASRDDRNVTWAELALQTLDDLRGPDGAPLRDEQGAVLVYNPGAVPLADRTLQAFILATTASQAHLNGTGLCTVTRL